MTEPDASEPIAVISLGCRLPGAENVDQFWANLRAETESITRFSDPEPVPRPRFVGAEGTLGDIAQFDAEFFGYSAREAEVMDPQHRLCLETAWTVFDTAGYDPAALSCPVGVFLSAGLSSYLVRNLLPSDELLRTFGGFSLLIHNDKDFAATTLSYKLGLTGPSMCVGSACSSSLVGVHLAIRSLQSFECDMAVAGGVSVQVPQAQGHVYAEEGIYSPDGRCAAFDASAAGTVGGSGVGLVLLKRLSDARRDGDRVHAVLLGSAVNNDGDHKAGFIAPGVDGQRDVIIEAHAVAGIDSGSVGYVEAHGTGTGIGDPVEVAALTAAFRATTDRSGFCAIGSVKSNIGHLDAAAGIAGLIKAVGAVRDGVIPASLHYRRPNPAIDFASSPFYVSASTTPWPASDSPRRAGVSSFGAGGTNAHVVLEQPPALTESDRERRACQLIVLSARSTAALTRAGDELAERLRTCPDADLGDVAATLSGRRAHRYRRAVAAATAADAATALTSPSPPRAVEDTGRTAFLFPGQGNGYPAMAVGLHAGEPVFRRHLDTCAHLLAEHGVELFAVLRAMRTGTQGAAALDQVAEFAVAYSLARTLRDWGVEPVAMLGHSLGEYVAATVAGVFTPSAALRLVTARAQAQATLPDGRMLAVPLSADELRPMLDGGLGLAAINASDRCVVSGATDAVTALADRLDRQGTRTRMLALRHAFHSRAVEPALDRFGTALAEVEFAAPRLPFLSNVTGDWADPAEVTRPEYWLEHMRRPVLFDAGAGRLAESAPAALLELGPDSRLARQAARRLPPGSASIGSCLPAADSGPTPERETAHLVGALGTLWTSGCPVDWDAFHRPQRPRRTPVPGYPFQRKRYWIEAPGEAAPVRPAAVERPGPRKQLGDWGYLPGWRHAAAVRPATRQDGATCLLFGDGPLGTAVAEQLTALGVHPVPVPAAPDGPSEARHYHELLSELAAQGRSPQLVVHLWPALSASEDRPLDETVVRQGQLAGLHSLLHLARAFGAHPGDRPVRLVAVTRGAQCVLGDDLDHPEHATVAAAVKVIPRELPTMSCTAMDVGRTDGDPDRLADRIVAELLAADEATEIAYRGRQRFERSYTPLRLDPAPEPPARATGGVHLICGGLGGIGLSLAESLAGGATALVLTRRTPFPAAEDWSSYLAAHPAGDDTTRLINRLTTLASRGTGLLVRQADVADETQMRAVVTEAEKLFGPITGVVHAAGVRDTAGMIQRRDQRATDEAMASKVLGPVVLDSVLRDRELDFLVLCSSIGTVVHKLKFGEVGYVAGNDFLDAYAAHRACRRGGTTVSIAWTDWTATGMGASAQEELAARYELTPENDALTADPLGGISRAEGVELFRRVLAADRSPQVLICTQDLEVLLARHTAFSTDDHRAVLAELRIAPSRLDRAELSTVYQAPGSPLERSVAACWENLLGSEPIGVHDSFFELGGDSLIALRLLPLVGERHGVELSTAEFFAAPTIAAQTAAIERDAGDEVLL
ncbi:type I polyketide synthase [Streptomyces pinistramenti]|uniref:type I polyketide synthase n=1 Tax=Streptomyces pinistramenti TaxID=2884812 RepID=UPI001D08084C|nr:type I polyketide synthase [Streptomyces pinistramenti]MCB5909710.1 acyltransferase domain-containing protein [Streptomyces pinistramenti]